jgi:hypothetical protein
MDEFIRHGTKNIGWLSQEHEFKRQESPSDILDIVWSFCKISVAQTRGIHECELCQNETHYAQRNAERLLIGSSEIRVFSDDGTIYAAPTLIYHYMQVHNYMPPDEFLRALKNGPAPSSQAYFERLKELKLEWSKTSVPAEEPLRFRLTS